MRCIGLDIGSTSIKGAWLDVDALEVGPIVKQPFPDPLPSTESGSFEIDPREVATRVERVVATIFEQAPESRQLWVSSQMGGCVLCDARGQWLSPYYSWRDQRAVRSDHGLSSVERIRHNWDQATFTSLGRELQPGSVSSLLVMLDERKRLPATYCPVSIADAVLVRLTQSTPFMHSTHALGLLELHQRTWHQRAYELLGLTGLCWPRLIDSLEPIGSWKLNGVSLEVFPALGDQPCALFGVGLESQQLSINCSTGSQVSCLTDTFEPGNYQTRCFIDRRYLNTITHLPAGRSLNVLVDLLTELARREGRELTRVWDSIREATESIEQSDLAVDLAFFSGPLGDRGSIRQISTENLSIGHLFFAAAQAMADNYALCSQRLSAEPNWTEVLLSGGLAHSLPILERMIAAKFPTPLRSSLATEESLLGLARAAQTVA